MAIVDEPSFSPPVSMTLKQAERLRLLSGLALCGLCYAIYALADFLVQFRLILQAPGVNDATRSNRGEYIVAGIFIYPISLTAGYLLISSIVRLFKMARGRGVHSSSRTQP